MNCWKTVNIQRDVGQGRVYLLSLISGMLAFIFLFLPYSILHLEAAIKDPGIWLISLMMLTLPFLHKIAHIASLGLLNKRIKIKWERKYWLIPFFSYQMLTSLSKKTSIIIWLAPTIFITVPCLILAVVFPAYYPYLLIFAAVNIGLSFSDFIYIKQFLQAPKKCIIENARDGYDILIKD